MVDALQRYFAGELAALDSIEVATAGTEPQERAWAALRRIPAGQTTTYGALGKSVGINDWRASVDMGAAVGANPIAIIVPCHRVLGANGDLKGYAWGLHRKRWLLEHEGAIEVRHRCTPHGIVVLMKFKRKKRSACGRTLADTEISGAEDMNASKQTRPDAERHAYASEEQRWAAVQARDVRADGHFVYGVRTTGVFCRPSSSARLPRRENVEFFDTEQAAEAAGYRASERACGDQTTAAAHRAAVVERACRLIERSETPPNLDELAEEIGMSPFHFHRMFKAETGLTPKAYASAFRAHKLREELGSNGAKVTDAIYGAGFNSNSRFYAASNGMLGMRARDYRAGGPNMQIRFAVGQCSLGAILVAQSQRGICAILLGDDPEVLVEDLQDQFPKALLMGGDAGFEQLVARVVGFIDAPSLGLNLPLDVRGTAFQERVWQALREIPPGATVSYAQVAARIGQPKAVRAVAQACGANPLAVAIPCHRVVRRSGELSGYRWGVERKRELLKREAG